MRKTINTYRRLLQKTMREMTQAQVGTSDARMARLQNKMRKYAEKIKQFNEEPKN